MSKAEKKTTFICEAINRLPNNRYSLKVKAHKQLSDLEQENKELRGWYEKVKKGFKVRGKKITKLKSRIEGLEKELEKKNERIKIMLQERLED